MKSLFPYMNVKLSKSVEFYTFLLSKLSISRYWLYIYILFNFNVINIVEKVGFSEGKIIILKTMWSPLWLWLGPLCFLANHSLPNAKKISLKWIHLLPGVIYTIFYVIIKLDLVSGISHNLGVIYRFSMFLVPISLVYYSINVIIHRTRELTKLEPFSELTVIISSFYLIVALLYFLISFFWLILDVDLAINYRYLIYGLLSIVAIFILIYWLMAIKRNNAFTSALPCPVPNDSYSNSKLKPEQVNDYKKRIEEHFNHAQCFLQSNLSLENLSLELNIPQHSLSQVFNLYLGSNFYSYIAKHRIEYALEQLKSNKGKLKIEALAYQCGFNSRSSFVRHFKEVTGYNPSGYCQKVEAEICNGL